MDYENKNFASKSTAGAALGTGIAGLSLGVLNSLGGCNGGLLGNLLGGCNSGCAENMAVSRYDAQKDARIAQLETEVKLRDANTYTDSKMLDMYRYFDGKIGCVERELADQRVYNTANTGAINCMQSQIAALMGLTKTIIPAANICPTPMPQYNSWTAPTAAAGA